MSVGFASMLTLAATLLLSFVGTCIASGQNTKERDVDGWNKMYEGRTGIKASGVGSAPRSAEAAESKNRWLLAPHNMSAESFQQAMHQAETNLVNRRPNYQ